MKTLIVTGGNINKNFLKNHLNLNKYDIIIAVDKGLESLDELEIKPDYIVGDFDSIEHQVLEKYNNSKFKITKLIPEKDFTDTHAGLNLSIELKAAEVTIIGGTRHKIRSHFGKYTYIKRCFRKKYQSENNKRK